MASTSIGRKELSFIHVDQSINSAHDQKRGCKVGGRMLKYKAHLFSPDDCTCHPYIHPIFQIVFFTCSYRFFVDMKYQNGLKHRRRMRPLLQYIKILYCSLKSSRLKRREAQCILRPTSYSLQFYSVEVQSKVTGK